MYQYSVPTAANGAVALDTLQYIAQEEGRVRPKNFGSTDTVFYDYVIKDHLGNTRVTLTDQPQRDMYPDASLESSTIATERLYYTGLDTGRVLVSGVSGYPTDTYTSPNNYTQQLSGNGPKVGTGILLKVMAGDSIIVRANSWYNNNATPNTSVSPLADIISALLGSVPAASGSKILQSQLNSTVLTPDVNSFLNTRNTGGNTSLPNAWLNVVVLDEQLNPVVNTGTGHDSYFQQVGANNTFTTHSANRLITKSGYVYVYVSNETPNINVFFDNLQVTQVRGPLLETDNYYPFGLTMAGISSKAANKLTNNIKFQKQEFQHQEFSDGSGLETYEFKWRMDDPQTGRFWQIDPLADKYVYNSTYAFSENKVTGHVELEGLEAVDAKTKETVVVDAGHGGNDGGTSKKNGTRNEADITLIVAKNVQARMQQRAKDAGANLNLVMTRTTDVNPGGTNGTQKESLKARVKTAKDNSADFFVSIHVNEAESSRPDYVHVYTKGSPNDASKSLQDNVVSALKGVVTSDQGVSGEQSTSPTQYVTQNQESNVGAVLIEIGFITNPTQETLMNDDAYLLKVGNAIGDAAFNTAYPWHPPMVSPNITSADSYITSNKYSFVH